MSPPIPWSIIARAAAWAMRKLPLAITSCWRSQSSSVVSNRGLEIERPALLTNRSMPPKASSRGVDGGRHLCLVGDVELDADRDVRVADVGRRRLSPCEVEVGDHDAGALGREPGWRWPGRCRRRRR